MATGTESLATFAEFLKILHVEDTITDAMSDNIVAYGELRRRGQIKKFEGRELRYPVKKARQFGVGWTQNNAPNLPAATVSDALEPVWNAKNVYAVGEINDEVIEDSMTSNASYERALEMIREDLMLSQRQVINAAVYDDGRARIGDTSGASNANPIQLRQPIYMFIGQMFDLIDLTDNQTRLLDDREVTDVDHIVATVDYSGATVAGTAAGDYATQHNTIGTGGEQRAIHGFRSGCLAANPPLENYGGVDRSVAGNTVYQGSVFGTSGANTPITELLIQGDINAVRRRSNFRLRDMLLWTNWNVVAQWFDELVKDRQLVVRGAEAMKLAGGFDTGSGDNGAIVGKFNGVHDILADENSHFGMIFYLQFGTWRIYETHPPELIQRDGNVLHRYENRGAYQFRSLWRAAQFTTAPSANGFRQGVAES
jgi:hypothetical protein